ncbi:MAG TPA: acyltransferase [Cyclobacteriaceae bacterium]
MGELCVYKHGGELTMGDFCFIGPRTRVQSSKRILIGSRVLIAHDVNIMDNNSHPIDSKERHLDFARFLKYGFAEKIDLNEAEIIIEDDVWIGFGSTILKGVKIGRGSIIGSNTVITKDVEAFSMMVGNPARLIKQTT